MTGRKTAGSLLSFVLLLFAPLTALAQERVRLAYPARSLSALHIRVAEERGFYRKYGLEVEAIQIRPTVSVVALLSGEVQYLASVGSAIRSAAMGAPIKIVSVALTAPFFSLVSRPQFRGVEDLRGKEIGLTGNPGSTNDRVLRLVLKQHGIDPQKDVALLHVGDPPVLYSAYKGGRFAAMFTSLPFPVIAEREGNRILVNAAESVRIPFMGIAVLEEKIKTSRDQIKRMIKAEVEARRFIAREKQATVEVITRWLGLETPLAARSYDLALPAISQEAMVDREGIRRVLEMETESGVALKLTRPEQITEGRIVEEAGSELSGRSK